MPKSDNSISMSVIKRMPRYYRFLGNLKKNGVERISSKELSQRMKLTASQIRQDLNCFGGFGQQGYGYNVNQLYDEISAILGINNGYKAVIIGMGNLGRALASHMKFSQTGFEIIGLFDKDENLAGSLVNEMTVRPTSTLKEFCEENKPTVAILCVPEAAAEKIVPEIIGYGITNFWNFSHYDISSVFPETVSENVHLNDSLMTLNYQIMHKNDTE